MFLEVGLLVGVVFRMCVGGVSVVCRGGCLFMGKISLRVSVRGQGARIESVPLRRLVLLSGYDKTRWRFEDGWLVLEAF